MSDVSSSGIKKRKWHNKDQNGCLRCKARHVKCEMSQPACQNCVRRGEKCQYPAPPAHQRGEVAQDATTTSTSFMPHTEATRLETPYTALDMELFHRFITTNYPSLPINSTHTWTQVMPMYAHDHDFLMHALLAYAATSSTAVDRPDFRMSALNHRMKALRCIWGTMAVADAADTSEKTRDALFGAWYLLSMQSFSLRDGWTDFLPLVRGVGLVMKAGLCQSETTAWGSNRIQTTEKRIRRVGTRRIWTSFPKSQIWNDGFFTESGSRMSFAYGANLPWNTNRMCKCFG